MRITFVGQVADLSGGFRVIAEYAQRLQDRGHTVTIVTVTPRRNSLRDMARALFKNRQLIGRSTAPKNHAQYTTVRHIVLDSEPIDISSSIPEADLIIATWWTTVNWVVAQPIEKGRKAQFLQDYEVWAGDVRDVDAACLVSLPRITPSQWVADFMRDRFAMKDIMVVPNGVDLLKFSSPSRQKQVSPTVGLTYTGFHAKGIDIALEAVQLAREEIPQLNLKAFGSARPSKDILRTVPMEFHYRVPDNELKLIYASCDCWLFPTRKEGFGLPILESMACGTPVIGTPAGAAPEIIGQGGGVLVPPEDPGVMATEIVKMARMSDSAWSSLSVQARSIAAGYSLEMATDRFEQALVEIYNR